MSSDTTQETPTEENDLAEIFAPIKPYLEKYGTKIALGLAAILLVVAAWTWFSKRSMAQASVGWGVMGSARSPEDFSEVFKDYPDSSAAVWARLRAGEGYLARGLGSSFTERDAAEKDYQNARDSFEFLLDKSGTPDVVRERSLWGMARLEEATSSEDTSAAVAAYEKLISDFPESVYKDLSEERIEELKSASSKKFYAWFSKQDRSLADDLLGPKDPPATPAIGEPGVMPPVTPGLPPAPGPVEGGEETPGEVQTPALPTPPAPAEEKAEAGTEPPKIPAPEEKPLPPVDDAKSGEASGDGGGSEDQE